MKPLIKAIMVAIIAAGVAVPSGYMAYEAFASSNPSMVHFIPLNSTFVLKASYNNTTLYLFNADNETGGLASVGIGQVSSLLTGGNSSSKGNVSSTVSVTPTYVQTFHGYKIYSLSNISISGIGRNSIISGNFSNSLNLSDLLHNGTLYIAELSGSTVSFGSLSAVHMSILSDVDNNAFSRVANIYFNSTANISVYVNYSNHYFKRLSGNVFLNSSSFNVVFSNRTFATRVDQALPLLLGNNITKIDYSYPYLNVTLAYGISYFRTSTNISLTRFNGTLL